MSWIIIDRKQKAKSKQLYVNIRFRHLSQAAFELDALLRPYPSDSTWRDRIVVVEDPAPSEEVLRRREAKTVNAARYRRILEGDRRKRANYYARVRLDPAKLDAFRAESRQRRIEYMQRLRLDPAKHARYLERLKANAAKRAGKEECCGVA